MVSQPGSSPTRPKSPCYNNLVNITADSTTESHPSSNCSRPAASPNKFPSPRFIDTLRCHSVIPLIRVWMILISFYLSAAWVISTICALYSNFLGLLELLLMWLNLGGVPPFRDTPLDKSRGCPDTRTPLGSPPMIGTLDMLCCADWRSGGRSLSER